MKSGVFWSTLYSPDVDFDLVLQFDLELAPMTPMSWLILMLTLVLLMTFDVDVNIEVDHCCRNRCFNIDGDFFILPLSMLSTLRSWMLSLLTLTLILTCLTLLLVVFEAVIDFYANAINGVDKDTTTSLQNPLSRKTPI